MKKIFKILLIITVFIFCALAFSGCGHYKSHEAAAWFRKNIVNETIAVSKEYTERTNEEGYTDRVWSAHLKDLPEVEFELISHSYYSLFPSYRMETTYDLEIGKYYADHYLDKTPDALDGLELSESEDSLQFHVSGIYDHIDEIPVLCGRIDDFERFLADQEYPCQIQYSLAYREPVTYPYSGFSPAGAPPRDTSVTEISSSPSSVESTAGLLEEKAYMAFAKYAVIYRLELDQFTEEQLQDAVNRDSGYRFTITRPDGTDICYPDLLLRYSNSMTFGCLYEVLKREGTYDVVGDPGNFSFRAADGSLCAFSYSYHKSADSLHLSPGEGNVSETFYYQSDDTMVLLSDEPFISKELFLLLTGSSYGTLKS